MSFVLVHGGMHGSWCWDRLIPRLNGPALAVNLPGRAGNVRDHAGLTITDFADSLTESIESTPWDDVIVVAHSFGGVPSTVAVSRDLPGVRGLIYLAAMVVPGGKSPVETLSEPYKSFHESLREAGETSYFADPVTFAQACCRNGTPEQIDFVARNSAPEPFGPMVDTMPQWALPDGVGVGYVRTLPDVVVPIVDQDRNIAHLGGPRVHDLDASHDAMVERPRETADVINHLASTFLEGDRAR